MCLSRCVPCFLHADEGTSIKKRGVLALSLQSALGAGSRRSADVNFSGDTFLTRILFSVMMTKTYARNKAPLYALLSHFADSCTNAFENGIEVVINDQRTNLHLCILGLKGDWPALTKCGRLNRHHLRDAPGSNNPAGICHLCLAGQTGYAWHEWDDSAAWLDTMDTAPLPWTTPSPLMKIPHDETDSADFFKIDLFHTMHKGVLADLAASTIATCIASIGGSVAKRLDAVYSDLVVWCGARGKQLHMSNLSTILVGWKRSSDYPTGNWFKGADTTVLTSFLQWRCERALADYDDEHEDYLQWITDALQALATPSSIR
ncbi:unnamed protein product [Effrenium voratum]|nr:unnamed protein product [Effrenium voratum]